MRFGKLATALGVAAALAGCSDAASGSRSADVAAATAEAPETSATAASADDRSDAALAGEGEQYLRARARILAAGWRPVRGECSGAGVTPEDCNEFPEIDTCSGTGVGYCGMAFSKPGQCLAITTIGGRPEKSQDSETKIGHATVQENACVRAGADAQEENRMNEAGPSPTLAASAETLCARLEREGIASSVLIDDFIPDYPAALKDPATVEQATLGADGMRDAVRMLTCGAGLSGFGPDVPEAALALFASRRHGGAAMTALRRLSVEGARTEAIAARNFSSRCRVTSRPRAKATVDLARQKPVVSGAFKRGRLVMPVLVILSARGEPDASRATVLDQEAGASGIKAEPRETAQRAPTATPPLRAQTATTASPPPLVRGQSRIPAALQGEWRVVAQTVSGDGVQAYSDNDPALIGARLSISDNGASWAGTASPLTGACEEAYFDGETGGAALAAARDGHAASFRRVGVAVDGMRDLHFLCTGERSNWGPSGEELRVMLLGDGRLVVPWFDNLLLILARD